MQSLMTNVPFLPTPFGVGLGAVTGTAVAIPPKKNPRTLAIQLVNSGNPGANVYNIMASNDNVNYTVFDATSLSNAGIATPVGIQINFNFPFIRIDQVSKTNAVTTTPSIVLVG